MSAQRVSLPDTSSPLPADRLFIASFQLPSDLDQLYQREHVRLERACKSYEAACFSQHFSAVRRRLAVLHSSSDSSSPVVGYVHGILKVSERYSGLAIGLDLELAATPGRFVTWMDTTGDWGYGIRVSGVRPRGDWLQLVGQPFPAEAWIWVKSPLFEARVEPIAGAILDLEPLRATFPGGTRRRISAGGYLIKRSSRREIEFRSEVPSDNGCDETIKPPRVMPPTLRATPAEFFNEDGSARFTIAYGKGC